MSHKSARRGVAASPLLIIGAVVVGIIVLLVASGSLKFSGYVRVDEPTKTPEVSSPAPAQSPAPAPQKTPTSAVKFAAEGYSGTNYTMSYPDGWVVQESGSTVAITLKEKEAGMLLITNPLGSLEGAKLSTIADANKLIAKQQFKNANFLKEEETKLNGQAAWRYELTANNDGTDIQIVYFVLADSNNMYTLIGTTTKTNWPELEESFLESFDTFKLKTT